MSLVGGLLFCSICGNLLKRERPIEKEIKCDVCEHTNPSESFQFQRRQDSVVEAAKGEIIFFITIRLRYLLS